MFAIQPQIGIDEILDALVHQRIESMTAELTTLRRAASSVDIEWDEVRCQISDLIAAKPPSEVAGIAPDLLKVWFSWDESIPCEDGLCALTMILCARYPMLNRNIECTKAYRLENPEPESEDAPIKVGDIVVIDGDGSLGIVTSLARGGELEKVNCAVQYCCNVEQCLRGVLSGGYGPVWRKDYPRRPSSPEEVLHAAIIRSAMLVRDTRKDADQAVADLQALARAYELLGDF